MSKPSLLLVFTLGMSLTAWQRLGIIDRELLIYQKLLDQSIIEKLYLLSYSAKDFKVPYHPKIVVLQKPIIFCFPGGNFLYSLLAAIIHRKQLQKVSIIKTNQMWGSWTAVLIKKFLKKPLIIRSGYTLSKNARKGFSRWLYEKIEAFAYQNCDQAIVTSKHDFTYVIQKYQPANITVIPNYIDTDLFKPLNLPAKKQLLYVGRLSAEKNLEYLIEIITNSNLQLDIFGTGPLWKKLQKKNNKNVLFKGRISNKQLPYIYNQYQAYIQLSKYEGSPKTVLEAMSCGVPVIASNVRGINELVQDNFTGKLLELNDPKNSQIITNLLANPKKLARFGVNGRKYLVENFSIEKVFSLEKSILTKIRGQR